jgi:SAM-dependent methyltransferase
MPTIPDFKDLRYLNEVGWFLYRERYGYNHYTDSYAGERMTWSEMLLDELTSIYGKDRAWIEDKIVLNVGCGCTGELAAWPAAAKIAADPLLYAYQKLGMLIDDAPGTARTLYLSVGVEGLPLLDESVDVVLCRNALDHMQDPRIGRDHLWRVLKTDGVFFLSVDIGGEPTPDEPSPFTEESLATLLEEQFEIITKRAESKPHNQHRSHSVRIVARKKGRSRAMLDKRAILRAYMIAVGALSESSDLEEGLDGQSIEPQSVSSHGRFAQDGRSAA